MKDDIRTKYHVKKLPTKLLYEYQLGLKNNEEYEKRFNEFFLNIIELFSERYKGVKIEPPRGREKSQKSLKEKITKLEIERLCKLYAIEDISEDEKDFLFSLILSKIKSKESYEKVKKIFCNNIEDIGLLESIIEEDEIENNIKTACLRIAKITLQKEEKNQSKNEEIINEIEEKFGTKAAEVSNKPEKNLLHWECIENINDNEEEVEKLHNPSEYLRVKDLRGFKIVIAEVPDDIETDNENLKELIKRRKEAKENEKTKYNDLCCIEVEKDFANYLISNQELLSSMNMELIKDGYKRKTKANGYIADHLKFCSLDHKEYNVEIQIKSIYREDISRANGTAAHDKRSGKKRIFPNTTDKDTFIKCLNYVLPKYTILERKDGKYVPRKCSIIENMMEFYMGYIKLDAEEFNKILNYFKEEQEEK